MKKFCQLSSREISVATLRLDPHNPRLRLHTGGTSEKELIERLCKVRNQSPSLVIKHLLADRGYLNNEIPVVYKAPGKSQLIVIDGNRRVAALKMIHDLTLVPSNRHGLRTDCEKLKGLVPDTIRYWVTSSISDAKRIVYRAHNEGSREWETLARYASHYDNHKAGQSIYDISEVTGAPQKEISNRINIWLLYEAMMIHILDFQIEDDGITNFERVTTSFSAFPKMLGITLDSEGVYQIPNNREVVEVVHLAYLKSAKSTLKGGFTREVANNDEARREFWKTILPNGFKPSTSDQTKPPHEKTNGSSIGSMKTGGSAGGSGAPSVQGGAGGPGNRPNQVGSDNPPTDRQILSLRKNVGKKASAIFDEYCKLQQHGEFPVACAALTRAMIETTLKHHAKRLGCYDETPDQQQKGHSDLLDNVATKLKKKIAGMSLPYCSDLLGAVTSCTKQITELNDVMHKDGVFSARPAVKSSLAALASAVENLVQIPDAK